MRLSVEQELYVRQVLALRVKALKKTYITVVSHRETDIWNEAIEEAVVEIMGSGPVDIHDCTTRNRCQPVHTYGEGCLFQGRRPDPIVADGCEEGEPGFLPGQRINYGKRLNGSHAPIEDVPLPPEPEDDDPWA